MAPGDSVGIKSRWNWYPLELVTSAGTTELSTLPDTVPPRGLARPAAGVV